MYPTNVISISDGNSPYHNLEQYMHNVDPNRDIVLLNKVRCG